MSSPGATNYTDGLNNFVAPADGTYYVATSGDIGAQFDLVITRGADFITKPNSTLATAQDISATPYLVKEPLSAKIRCSPLLKVSVHCAGVLGKSV